MIGIAFSHAFGYFVGQAQQAMRHALAAQAFERREAQLGWGLGRGGETGAARPSPVRCMGPAVVQAPRDKVPVGSRSQVAAEDGSTARSQEYVEADTDRWGRIGGCRRRCHLGSRHNRGVRTITAGGIWEGVFLAMESDVDILLVQQHCIAGPELP